MARRDRDQEKKRRRQKRLDKKRRASEGPLPLLPMRRLVETLETPMPAHWPGASDPSLARPDVVKFELAEFAIGSEPGKSKEKQLSQGLRKGALGFLPELDHWAMEEFLWHGLPGDPWHPIEAFLAQSGDRFPPPAQAQLRRWKAAQIGLFEVGKIQNETLALREWDPVNATLRAPVQAVALSIGGINSYRASQGKITLTYVAPWLPAENLYCAMGYGITVPKGEAALAVPDLGLRYPDVVSRPLPWELNRATEKEYVRRWRQREWHSWLREHLQFPFWALVAMPPKGQPVLKQVTELIPSTPEQAYQLGIYLAVPLGKEVVVAGGTMVTPLDVTSANFRALTEYHAYRHRAGPPPGTVGQPDFMTFEP